MTVPIAAPGATEYTETSLVLGDDLTVDQWRYVLAGLGAISKGHQWWCGDALVFGETHFGDEVTFQAADLLSLEPHTLTNYRWVAASVEVSRRRDELTWSHHAEVARLKPGEQRKALKWAVDHDAGVRELRDYVALTWPSGDGPSVRDPIDVDPREEVALNEAIERVTLALDADDPADPRDVRVLVEFVRRALRGGS